MFKIYNKCNKFTGNNTTLERLSKLLNLPITTKIENNIIGIHAYKFGKLVIDKGLTYILIIGGTDINIDIHDKQKMKIMTKAINQAKAIVVFSVYIMHYKLLNLFNILDPEKIYIIPQSVRYMKPKKFNLREHLGINPKKIFLQVGNLRSVKDPLYLKDVFKELYKKNIVLVLIGKVLEDEYNDINVLGIYHIDGLSKPEIFDCYTQADGFINTSKSEGMSNAILEAMIMKCPVFARNIYSNRTIITHEYNGYIFNSPDDFLKIYNNTTKKIINNAYKYIVKYHNSELEKKRYEDIINKNNKKLIL